MSVTVGVAPDSWGIWFPSDPHQVGWPRYLDEVVEAGFEWIELGPVGYLPTDVPTLRDVLGRRSLHVAGGTFGGSFQKSDAWPEIERTVLEVGELTAALGGRYLVALPDMYGDLYTGELIAPRVLADDAWKQLVEHLERAGALARDRFGITVVFHPHAESNVEYEDQIEHLLADSDPGLVRLVLDVGHHAYCSGDPVAFMRKHHARIPYLHLKSVDRALRDAVQAERVPLATAVKMGTFCEPEVGVVDFPALVKVLGEVGYDGFGIVEQDMYPVAPDKPLPIAKRTRAYLRQIGMG